MGPLSRLGRILFAVSMVVFAVQYFLYGRFVGGLPPVPPWTPGGAVGAYLVGTVLFITGVCLAANQKAALHGILLGSLCLFSTLFLHLQKYSEVLHDGVARTRALDALSLAGAAFFLAGASVVTGSSASGSDRLAQKLAPLGRFLFAFSLVVFGVQHFMYAPFIATLIPSWIPAHLFFAYFTGFAMIAAGLSFAVKISARLAGILIGSMFLFWVLFLHAPRVLAQPRNGDEWSSAFVALAMAGASFCLAGILEKRKS